MYMCIYIQIYDMYMCVCYMHSINSFCICVYVCLYALIETREHDCNHVRIDKHTYMHACIHAYIHTCIHAYMQHHDTEQYITVTNLHTHKTDSTENGITQHNTTHTHKHTYIL